MLHTLTTERENLVAFISEEPKTSYRREGEDGCLIKTMTYTGNTFGKRRENQIDHIHIGNLFLTKPKIW